MQHEDEEEKKRREDYRVDLTTLTIFARLLSSFVIYPALISFVPLEFFL